MKRNLLWGILLLGLAASCGPKKTQPSDLTNGVPSEVVRQQTPQLTDTLPTALCSLHAEDSTAVSGLSIAFPVETRKNQPLARAIREWISEQLGGTYDAGDTFLSDTAALTHHYFQAIQKRNADQVSEMLAYSDDQAHAPFQMLEETQITKLAEGPHWVTYQLTTDTYGGGAHGSHLVFGQTFRKSDGRRMGWEMFATQAPTPKDEHAETDLQAVLRKGLVDYFSADGQQPLREEDLGDMLLDPNARYYIPLPQCPPLLTDKGILFLYNQYEIAPYAAGLPGFVVSYPEIKPYLNVTAQRII